LAGQSSQYTPQPNAEDKMTRTGRSKTRAILLITALAVSACGGPTSTEPVSLSVIGSSPRLIDPEQGMGDETAKLVMTSTAQGLVGFDSAGQIEPGLAERWNITNGGLNYIFRISEATWPDGREVGSVEVAQILRRMVAARSRDGSAPMLSTIVAIVPMTPRVIDIRLSAPLPGLLQVLAQPDMVISQKGRGTGPYRLHSQREGVTRLRIIPTPDEYGELPDLATQERNDVRVRGESASRAVTRFVTGGTMLVVGGKFQDLPLVSATDPGNGRFRVDPTPGLFGLRVLRTDGGFGDANIRKALSIAINREEALGLVRGDSWEPVNSILPRQLESASLPAMLGLLDGTQSSRIETAKNLIGEKKIKVRLALPAGPGARLLFAALARDWRLIGVETELTQSGQPADMALIDEVATTNSALWYLGRLGCQTRLPCSSDADAALAKAVQATTAADRGAAIAEADAAQASAHYFIPLAQPLRWSLVEPDLTGWRDNGFGAHPLRHLRAIAR
jgi:peptide/nickel transport system substrate-binding protein